MKKNLICLFLALAMMFSILPANANAAAVDDYTQWKQYDPDWNQEEAWPAWQYPYATARYMNQVGCAVTAVAMLLRHYDVVPENDVESFNPWVCNEALRTVGGFDDFDEKDADIVWGNISAAYPGFVFRGWVAYDFQTLKALFDEGYACVVQVYGSGGYNDHYVAVKEISGDNVVIMDPGSEATNLSAHGAARSILYFETTPAKREYVDYCEEYPSYGKIRVTKKAYLMSQPCSSGTDSSSIYIESVAKNKELTVTGMFMNTQGNLWYRVTAPNSGDEAYIPSSHTAWICRLTSDVKIAGVSAPTALNVGNVFCIRGNVESVYNTLEKVSAYVYSGVTVVGTPATGREVSVNATGYELYNSEVDAGVEFNYLAEGGYSYVIRATTGKCYYAVNEKTVGELEPAEIVLHMSTFTVGDVPGFAVNTYDTSRLNAFIQK